MPSFFLLWEAEVSKVTAGMDLSPAYEGIKFLALCESALSSKVCVRRDTFVRWYQLGFCSAQMVLACPFIYLFWKSVFACKLLFWVLWSYKAADLISSGLILWFITLMLLPLLHVFSPDVWCTLQRSLWPEIAPVLHSQSGRTIVRLIKPEPLRALNWDVCMYGIRSLKEEEKACVKPKVKACIKWYPYPLARLHVHERRWQTPWSASSKLLSGLIKTEQLRNRDKILLSVISPAQRPLSSTMHYCPHPK